MKDRRVVWPEAGRVEVEDFEIQSPNEDELLIRSELTLISPGTERASLLGLPNTPKNYPMYPGYSNIGEVIEVGEGVQGISVGDKVASVGNHASLITIAANRALKVPDNVPSEEAVFFNLWCISLQGVRKAKIELGESVLILGQGLIGQLALQLAKLSGGFPTITADVAADRLELSLRLGADLILNPKGDNFEKRLLEATGGMGANVVIEATGAPEPVNTAFHLASHLGRVVLLASTRGETPEVNFYRDVHKKGLTIFGAHNSIRPAGESSANFWSWKDDGNLVLKLMANRKIKTSEFVSHRLTSERAPQAYSFLTEGGTDVMGIILEW